MSGYDDTHLADLIREAHRDTHLAVPLSRIIAARPRRRVGLAVAAAAAVLVCVVLFGMAWVLLGGQPIGLQPALPSPSASPPGKPPRPSSSATTALGRCADFARPELAAEGMTELPPLRFEREVVPAELRLLIYADDERNVACWLGAEQHSVEIDQSNLTTDMDPAHPPGRLSNVSANWGSNPAAAYTFGRVPEGTTRVEVHFPGGTVRQATLENGWYLLTGTGEDSYAFSEITKIVAVTPGGRQELPVLHG
ncbi:hypothetical protein ACFQY4_13620 [Catellatospora bangladeshensis]|uniref:Uncharacterized protein n=1 Tax=Catellatospora bangladeshensis TaxID=310355 RepID=A0A8J3NNK3_9ACTN|nr:hypothetical protein [Catellatospora bangladeshensis]GIF84950.1 hypothetical protein Cba03nite_62990 [Catellatospora bangladeshensis]